jgi:hypothetical protein
MQACRFSPTLRHLTPAALTLALVALSGCTWMQRERGSQESDDQHVYVSRPWEPKTVSLIDTRNDEVIWSYEVPVGEKLVIRFEDHNKPEPGETMLWGAGDPNKGKIRLINEIPVPDSSIRKLSWVMRPVPEYAASGDETGSGG